MSDSCRSCGEEIVWASHHESGNRMPLEEATEKQVQDGRGLWRLKDGEALPASTEDGTGLFPVQLYISHFATCPERESWRGRSRGED